MSQQFFVGEMPVRGSNLSASSDNLPPGYGRYLQDIIIESDGTLRRRGPLLDSPFAIAASGLTVSGMVYAYTPTGTLRFLGQGGGGATPTRVWSTSGALLGDFTAGPLAMTEFNFRSQWCTGFDGAAVIGTTTSTAQSLIFWRGGYVQTTNGVISLTTTSGLTALTAASAVFVAGHVGCFVTINGVYVGCIKSITSTTVAVLEEGALATAVNVVNVISPIRGINVTPSPGLIHTETTTGAIVGAGTKFLELGCATGTWDIFHLRNDGSNTGVQTLSAATVTNNTNIAFGAGAGYAMDFERYKLNNRGATVSTLSISDTSAGTFQTSRTNLNTPGFLPTLYADRMWYANRGTSQQDKSSVWFSERGQQENIDMSPTTGNKLTIGDESDRAEILATLGTVSGLLIFKSNATYLLSGKNPSNFQINRISDDGIVSARAICKYGTGAIWAGYKGIYYYDGNLPRNLVETSLGNQYTTFMQLVDVVPEFTAMCVSNDHLLVSIGQGGGSDIFSRDAKPWYAFSKNIYSPIMRGTAPTYYADNFVAASNRTMTSFHDDVNSADSGESVTLSINLLTDALVFFRNMKFHWALPITGIINTVGVQNNEDNYLVGYNQIKESNTSYGKALPAIVGTASIFSRSGLDQVDTTYDVSIASGNFRKPKPAYWQTFHDTFSSTTLNTNWTKVGNIDLTTSPGNCKPADVAGFSLELTPQWQSAQPYNYMRMVFTTGTSTVGFANRMRIYTSVKNHNIEAEINAAALRILVDGVQVATTAFAPAISTQYYMSFWMWGGRAIVVISTAAGINYPDFYGQMAGTFTNYAMTPTEIDYFEDSSGGGKPYFACDVAVTSESVQEVTVVPLKQSAGPRFYFDTGIKPLDTYNVEKWTKNVKVVYAAACGSLSAYVLNDVDADTDSDTQRLPVTVAVGVWSDGSTSWRYWDNQSRNWTRFPAFFNSTTNPQIDTRTITPWANYKLDVGDRGVGIGVRIIQDHLQLSDARVKSWLIGYTALRGDRSGGT